MTPSLGVFILSVSYLFLTTILFFQGQQEGIKRVHADMGANSRIFTDDFSYGGEGGILSENPKKFSVVMVKRKSNGINGRFDEKPFCQCHWEI